VGVECVDLLTPPRQEQPADEVTGLTASGTQTRSPRGCVMVVVVGLVAVAVGLAFDYDHAMSDRMLEGVEVGGETSQG
jgi:hypothetical protein